MKSNLPGEVVKQLDFIVVGLMLNQLLVITNKKQENVNVAIIHQNVTKQNKLSLKNSNTSTLIQR